MWIALVVGLAARPLYCVTCSGLCSDNSTEEVPTDGGCDAPRWSNFRSPYRSRFPDRLANDAREPALLGGPDRRVRDGHRPCAVAALWLDGELDELSTAMQER
jgi:hypothetical protein